MVRAALDGTRVVCQPFLWPLLATIVLTLACARRIAGQVDHAHYSLQVVGDVLEGTYHEDGDVGPENEAIVRVTFDDASGLYGSFEFAKVPPPQPSKEGEEPPTPQQKPETKPVFHFAFRPQSDGRFYVSESQ